jgi:thiol-disulfide isomerase/thioredoxin
MKKIVLVALLMMSFSIKAQDTIRVKMTPNEGYKWLMLYKINGAKQQYISNTTIENDEFKLPVAEGNATGIYRIFYDMDNGGYLDFVYNQEPISLSFNPNLPEQTAEFEKSEENKLLQSYFNSILEKQTKVDSVQMVYFDAEDKKSLQKMYTDRLNDLNSMQTYFEKESEGKFANDIINVTKKYNNPEILETVESYLGSLETHFFDNIDFSNKALLNSSVFVDKSIEYVFYINSSEDPETQRKLREKSINEVMSKIGDNVNVKAGVLSSLIYAFAGQEELESVDFLKTGYYNQLPEELQDAKFIADVDRMLSVALGRVAPEITWEEDGKTKKLSELEGAENYLITFWSTSCSHCLEEIPELYKVTKDNEKIKVIAIALEEDKFGFDHHTEMMDKWINVLGLKKWENEIARSYEIHSTPSYFMLDKDKKITAKPEELVDVLKIITPKEKVEE